MEIKYIVLYCITEVTSTLFRSVNGLQHINARARQFVVNTLFYRSEELLFSSPHKTALLCDPIKIVPAETDRAKYIVFTGHNRRRIQAGANAWRNVEGVGPNSGQKYFLKTEGEGPGFLCGAR